MIQQAMVATSYIRRKFVLSENVICRLMRHSSASFNTPDFFCAAIYRRVPSPKIAFSDPLRTTCDQLQSSIDCLSAVMQSAGRKQAAVVMS